MQDRDRRKLIGMIGGIVLLLVLIVVIVASRKLGELADSPAAGDEAAIRSVVADYAAIATYADYVRFFESRVCPSSQPTAETFAQLRARGDAPIPKDGSTQDVGFKLDGISTVTVTGDRASAHVTGSTVLDPKATGTLEGLPPSERRERTLRVDATLPLLRTDGTWRLCHQGQAG